MTCKCGSNRIAEVRGKCADLSTTSIPHLDFEHEGYVMDLGVGSGDNVELSFCLDCGHIQGFLPISDEEITEMEEFDLKPGAQRRHARYYGEEHLAQDSDGPQAKTPEPDVMSMKIVEMQRITKLLVGAFGADWQADAEAIEILHDELKIAASTATREAIEELLNGR